MGRRSSVTMLSALVSVVFAMSSATLHAAQEVAAEPAALGDTNADLVYTPVVPCRIMDTRLGGGPLAPGVVRDVVVVGSGAAFALQGGNVAGCGIPSGAGAVMMNFVAISPAGPGNLRAWAYSTPPVAAPLAAILNYNLNPDAPLNLANGIAVPICDPTATTCTFDLRVGAFVSGIDLVIDVVGYFNKTVLPAVPTGTGFRHVTGGSEDPTAKLVSNADVDSAAGIAESKLALAFPTHSNANDPTAGQKAALAGTSGTPAAANQYVTNSDARNSNARPPTAHGSTAHDNTVASRDTGSLTVPPSQLGTGTANGTTFLRGDRAFGMAAGVKSSGPSSAVVLVSTAEVELRFLSVAFPASGTAVIVSESTFNASTANVYLNCGLYQDGIFLRFWNWDPGDADGWYDLRQSHHATLGVPAGTHTYSLRCQANSGTANSSLAEITVMFFAAALP